MLNINGEDWRILLVSPTHHKLLNSEGGYSLGVCDDNDKTIYINDNLSAEKTKKVLCHEISHAAMFSFNVDLSIDQEELLADLVATFGQEIIWETNRIFHRIKEKWEAS